MNSPKKALQFFTTFAILFILIAQMGFSIAGGHVVMANTPAHPQIFRASCDLPNCVGSQLQCDIKYPAPSTGYSNCTASGANSFFDNGCAPGTDNYCWFTIYGCAPSTGIVNCYCTSDACKEDVCGTPNHSSCEPNFGENVNNCPEDCPRFAPQKPIIYTPSLVGCANNKATVRISWFSKFSTLDSNTGAGSDAVSPANINYFEIYESSIGPSNPNSYLPIATIQNPSSPPYPKSFIKTNVPDGTHWYAVKAFNAVGNSGASEGIENAFIQTSCTVLEPACTITSNKMVLNPNENSDFSVKANNFFTKISNQDITISCNGANASSPQLTQSAQDENIFTGTCAGFNSSGAISAVIKNNNRVVSCSLPISVGLFASAGSDSQLIAGESMALGGTGNGGSGVLDYNWSIENNSELKNKCTIINPQNKNAFFSCNFDGNYYPAETAVLTLNVTDSSGGASSEDSKNILILPKLFVSAGSDRTLQLGSTQNIAAEILGGTPPYNVSWDWALGENSVCKFYSPSSKSTGIYCTSIPEEGFSTARVTVSDSSKVPQQVFDLVNINVAQKTCASLGAVCLASCPASFKIDPSDPVCNIGSDQMNCCITKSADSNLVSVLDLSGGFDGNSTLSFTFQCSAEVRDLTLVVEEIGFGWFNSINIPFCSTTPQSASITSWDIPKNALLNASITVPQGVACDLCSATTGIDTATKFQEEPSLLMESETALPLLVVTVILIIILTAVFTFGVGKRKK